LVPTPLPSYPRKLASRAVRSAPTAWARLREGDEKGKTTIICLIRATRSFHGRSVSVGRQMALGKEYNAARLRTLYALRLLRDEAHLVTNLELIKTCRQRRCCDEK